MKKIFTYIFIIVVCLFLTMPSGANEIKNILGNWEGTLKVPGTELRIVFRVYETTEGNISATMDSPDQGVRGILVNEIIQDDNNLILEIKAIGGVFEGVISEEGLIIEGQWKQSGAAFPLLLEKKEEIKEIVRPQEPLRPYPYIEEDVEYENKEAGITLSGTLTFPAKKGPFPAVLLISGSGPQDRNETIAGHRPFLVLADYLTRKGIAVLRVDDRGVGKSTGDFSQATSEDFASDVLEGVEYLKNRTEINTKQIGLIGHSEGGLIAPMVAVQSRDVSFIVLMAGPGLPGEEILYLQGDLILRAMGFSEEKIARDLGYNKKLYSLIKEEDEKEILKERASEIFEEYYFELSEEEKQEIGNWDVYV
ncbi:MAG: alpha/beta fold hydrolase, partial [Atribacterota bacterium]|nr:alpha/beta fold hydrolase [Atribacterota bacterium]